MFSFFSQQKKPSKFSKNKTTTAMKTTSKEYTYSSKFLFSLLIFLSLSLSFYSLKSFYTHTSPCPTTTFDSLSSATHISLPEPEPAPTHHDEETDLQHIVFGIGAAARHWARRKEYVKFWFKPNQTRAFVWLDKPVNLSKPEDRFRYPELKISSNTDRFRYSNRKGNRSALRMTRIVSEMVRMGLRNVRWFVMADDDTIFFTENLVRVLRKYNHTRMYYIGAHSETHLQNIRFSYGMAYGGGGFAISYPLAKAIEKMQDRCIERYTDLYGSDDRIQACLAELGVPLTQEPGFHQFDVYGNLFGLLTSHPLAPLVTMHHLDILEPIFPMMGRLPALKRLRGPAKLDSAGLMQQSICYDTARNWTISVSWGYAVQIIRGIITPREMEQPARTFFNWYKKDDATGLSFNTRPFTKHPCQKPYVYYFSKAVPDPRTNVTGSDYALHRMPHPWCWWTVENPERIYRVEVYKKPDPHKWDEEPRRDCCRVLPTDKEGTVVIDVGKCRDGEVMEAPLL